MVRLVFIADAHKYRDCLVLARLADRDGLKAALERGILFDMLTVFFERGCTDDLHLAAGKRGLQNIRGIDRTFRRACTDERMQFVYKENDIPRL